MNLARVNFYLSNRRTQISLVTGSKSGGFFIIVNILLLDMKAIALNKKRDKKPFAKYPF